MKVVKFQSLLLVSNVLKKSRLITFGETTVITGSRNTTGKSSVLKSLYHTLGANVVFEDEWHPLEVKSLLRFTCDGVAYLAFRDGQQITFLDQNVKVLVSTDSITTVLSSFISGLFDFNLPLVLSANNEEIQAIPAVLFLPFYIDQDLGWGSYFSSFTGLQMFSRWQEAFKNYHTGIRPREFYELGNRIRSEEKNLRDLENEHEILTRTKQRVEASLVSPSTEIDVDQLREHLQPLLEKYGELQATENEIRKRSYRLAEDHFEIARQIQEITEQISNNEAELVSASDFSEVVCPRCGSVHESKLYHEYALSTDTIDSKEFLQALKAEEEKLRIEAGTLDQLYQEAKVSTSAIRSEVTKFQSEISLSDVLHTIARKKAEDVFDSEVADNNGKQEKVVTSIGKMERERKGLLDKKRSKKIKDDFIQFLNGFFHDLSVDSSDLKAYRSHFTPPQSKLKTGSRGARQMLGLYYAFINTVYKYSTSARFPIVVDSPKQQEQDNMNADVIGNFCTKNRPDSAQVVLATLNYRSDDKSVTVYHLEEEKGLLLDDDYLAHSFEIQNLKDLVTKHIDDNLTSNST